MQACPHYDWRVSRFCRPGSGLYVRMRWGVDSTPRNLLHASMTQGIRSVSKESRKHTPQSHTPRSHAPDSLSISTISRNSCTTCNTPPPSSLEPHPPHPAEAPKQLALVYAPRLPDASCTGEGVYFAHGRTKIDSNRSLPCIMILKS